MTGQQRLTETSLVLITAHI